MRYRKILKRLGWLSIFLFVVINIAAYRHAYTFTHFSDRNAARTKDPKELTYFSKLRILFTGISNPKPTNKLKPLLPYQTITINGHEQLEAWYLKKPEAKGTVILFHGYAGEKSSLISRSAAFLDLGYSTLLVDFPGSGGSQGDHTTIGFKEAEQVKACYDFIRKTGEKSILLFGTSMGAVAILKAIDDYHFRPKAIIIECPFGSLYKTVQNRFDLMGVPNFPMAGLLTFWGGFQNGYWAFSHNPTAYAKSVVCPSLLFYGEKDERVTREEIDEIYFNLNGIKMLKSYPEVGHNVFVPKNLQRWKNDVSVFLTNLLAVHS